MKISMIVGLVLTGIMVTAVDAAEYYVAATGSDSNSGTSPAQAWKTLSKVQSEMSQFTADAKSGSVTVFFNNENTWIDQQLDITCVGAPGNWISFDGTAWGGTASGTSRAIIRQTRSSGKSMIDIKYGDGTYAQDAYVAVQGFDVDGNGFVDNVLLRALNASYLKILDNEIHDPLTGDGKYTPTVFLTTSGDVAGKIEIHDLEVSNNEIHGSGVHGMAFYPSTGSNVSSELDNVGNITVTNNHIYNFGNSYPYGSGIQVMSCYGGIIADNIIHDGAVSDGFGIKVEDRSRECRDINIFRNTIYGEPGGELRVGISSDGGQNINVYNNIIRGTILNGIGWGSPSAASGNIYNNTISGTGATPVYISSSSSVGIYENNVSGAVFISNDSEAPAVSMTVLSDGEELSGSAVTVSASASDNVGVAGVQFRLNGADLGAEDTFAPFSVEWDTTGYVNGSYTLTAVARDSAGNSQISSAVSVTVTNVPLPADAIVSVANTWQNQAFDAGSNLFEFEFEAIPQSELIDCLTGLSLGSAAGYDDLAVIVRFHNDGLIDVRNGDVYAADTAISYGVDVSYHFRLVVNVSEHTYSVFVRTDDGPERLLAGNYAFRTSQAAVDTLDTLAVTAFSGSHIVFNIANNQIVDAAPLPADAILSEANTWQNQAFDTESGLFEFEFEAIPQSEQVDCLTGLSLGSAAGYDDLAVIVRFHNDGLIDVRNGDVYASDTTVSYAVGVSYRFRLVVNVPSHTYSVFVRVDDGPETLLAGDYAFRTSQDAINTLDTVAVTAASGSHIVFNFAHSQIAVATPAAPAGLRIHLN